MINFLTRAAVAAAIVVFAVPAGAQGFKIVAHPEVPLTEIGQTAASNLFLKKDRKLGGVEAAPIDQPASSPVRDAFSKAVHGRATSAVVTYWQQQVFSGKDTPPPSKPSDDAILAFVKSTPGAIGYVSEGASTDGVKVLKIKAL